jgi:hypothetical protein
MSWLQQSLLALGCDFAENGFLKSQIAEASLEADISVLVYNLSELSILSMLNTLKGTRPVDKGGGAIIKTGLSSSRQSCHATHEASLAACHRRL